MKYIHFLISKRYFFSKKSINLINYISIITLLAYIIGTFSLVIIISIFNGLEWLIKERYKSFDPDLKVVPKKGKFIYVSDSLKLKLNSFSEIKKYSFVIEEIIIAKYFNKYYPFKIKGVEINYEDVVNLKNLIIDGNFCLMYDNVPVAIIGSMVSSMLNYNLNSFVPIHLYAVNRNINPTKMFEQPFFTKTIYSFGIYSVEPEYDNYIITTLPFVKNLLQYNNEITAIEIKLNKDVDPDKFEELIQESLGNDYDVLNRFEQHATLFKIMKIEKIVVFLILVFILIIASFNITSSLTMLILEKKDDIFILKSFGLTQKDIRKIFQLEGWYISILGTLLGLILALIFCFLHIKFGIIPMSLSNPELFIVKYYPMKLKFFDIFLIFCTVLFIGYITAKYPVRFITQKFIQDNFKFV